MIRELNPIDRSGKQSSRRLPAWTGILAAACLAALAGCSTYDSVTQRFAQRITPYRITIVQGNFVSREAASQMHVGMTRAQVRQLLGTPLLTDMFHGNRWDYVFYFKRGSTAVVQQRDFVVMFNGDAVASWSGGENLPSNLELLAEIDGDKGGKKRSAKAAVAASAAAAPTSAPVAATAPAAAPAPASSAVATVTVPANEQAADAANRATSAVQMPAGVTSSARASAPEAPGGVVPVSGTPPQQLQLHRPAQPTTNADAANAVGPTVSDPGTGTLGSDGGLSPARNAPLAAPPVPASSAAQ